MNKHTLPKVAVFDVDRTLLKRTSGEMQLILYLAQKKMLPRAIFFRVLREMIRQFFRGFSHTVLRNKMFLQGVHRDAILAVMDDFFETRLEPRLSPAILDQWDTLKNEGYELYIVSGTLDFIVNCLVEKLGAKGGAGSKMQVEGGCFTGRVEGPYLFHREKVSAFRRLIQSRDVDYENSWAFGDSGGDAPILALFGHPVAANPGILLTVIARQKKWTIVRD